ncbi:MAG: presqualene diphosphate synthase HpnD [Tepidimonas sp.]|uniref:presqualene diphosphate synthase HpnD n=1 Tax=Tepidimonas sp. TaxID=2002775 RepID=UPI00298EDE69|nr:presqualene diphosphate synthase HpnD [Tepidimonas sp.]MDW8335557.1 presqualene diphosphate synthase HpnD [Tepidimonas sp.]
MNAPHLHHAQAWAAERAAASGSSFYYAFLFLPPQQRAAITAFYAFCREIDDIVDEVREPSVAQAKLAWWRQQVALAFTPGRTADHPALIALQPHIAPFGLRPEPLLAVIDGCELDLQQNRWLDYAALTQYCHLVAGVVGEVAARIFGQTEPGTTAYAHRLGLALQLTNIIRDVGEDALRGRIYLPLDELKRFDVRPRELLTLGQQAEPGFEARFAALMRFQIERALATYDEAVQLLPAADRARQKPGLMMASIYRALLRSLARQPQRVLRERISLPPLRKLWLAWKVQALGRW